MSSAYTRFKQVPANDAYYVNVGDLRASLLQNWNSSDDAPLMSTAGWVVATAASASTQSTLANAGRAFLRDMGKNIISSGRVFRRVQLLAPTSAGISTGGVTGAAGSTTVQPDYYTAYIELPGLQGVTSGASGAHFVAGAYGSVAPVARLG